MNGYTKTKFQPCAKLDANTSDVIQKTIQNERRNTR
jgi:hypothetical protein